MNRETIANVQSITLAEARVGVVGLWAILMEVNSQLPLLNADAARDATLSVIESVLRDRIVVGQFVDPTDGDVIPFVPWQLSIPDALARIERERRVINDTHQREPTIGEIAWFIDPQLLPLAMERPRAR